MDLGVWGFSWFRLWGLGFQVSAEGCAGGRGQEVRRVRKQQTRKEKSRSPYWEPVPDSGRLHQR